MRYISDLYSIDFGESAPPSPAAPVVGRRGGATAPHCPPPCITIASHTAAPAASSQLAHAPAASSLAVLQFKVPMHHDDFHRASHPVRPASALSIARQRGQPRGHTHYVRLVASGRRHAFNAHDGLSRRGRRIPTSSVRLAMGKQTNARGAWSAADVASPHHRPSCSNRVTATASATWPSAWRQELLCASPRKPIWHLSSTVSRHSSQGVQSATRKEPDRTLVG